MDFLLFLIIIVFLIGFEMAIPFLTKRNVVFGVYIPDEFARDPKLLAFKKRFSLLIFIFGVIGVGLYLFLLTKVNLNESMNALLGSAIQFSLIFMSLALYFYYHAKALQRKKAMRWGENVKQVTITDLSVRSQDAMLPWHVYLLPIAVTIGVMIYTLTKFSLLPEQIPMHWGPNGKPDAFAAKSQFSAISLLLILLTIQFMFLGINEMTKRSGFKLSATRPEASRIRQLTLRKYSSWFMFFTNVLITMLFSFLQLQMIHPNLADGAVLMALPIIFTLMILIGCLYLAIKVGTAGERMDLHPASGISDLDDDQYWKGGLFYFNKNDPSIFVEKRFGIGWTLNFSNPVGYIVLLGPIVIILLISYFS
ncbi:DUF1648 domain-containing protein [Cytobacillus depressus]|uniref:DUF1648 domain-containing protein n=1 Tax=Cytobacillus depressus TaxID=1602942 RepID=A0A6L3V9I7_9BACI|nr:DUF5808 domain-containing protein [Cytobacillus depressus]KAB2336027.1 DUF1648 domain-containing protein [Cytobacillus depressus]